MKLFSIISKLFSSNYKPENYTLNVGDIYIIRLEPPKGYDVEENGVYFHVIDSKREETYRILTKKSADNLGFWLREYAQEGPRCSKCGCLIFPGYPIGTDEGKKIHMVEMCCDSKGLLAGYVKKDGSIDYIYPDGENTIENVFKTGDAVFGNIKMLPTLEEQNFVVTNFAPKIIKAPTPNQTSKNL